ncbi:glycerophosphodiester phosphodiesterase [Natribacillus halophilus]|uniref:Glycerophosphoryl diester phosphodiesterase n=1 Tax=Natribacillus halophilus TaxID=549003 RepID=A0A1G8NMW6_9BACI|nr:glycerophosphodiester phosphodiesterase [Natribacillus halophilus]SDI81525.1 glycerophosphoryl diester phosphodiesterase [Natribacillus halophilus]
MNTERDALVIAHRGVTGVDMVENTVKAFERAVALDADFIETDVRRTADGYLICFHDGKLDGSAVKKMNYASLQQYARMIGWELPLLEEVLRLCKGNLRLDIEIKAKGLEKQVVEEVNATGMSNEVLITSFHDSVLRKIKLHDAAIKTGLLLGRRLFQQRFRLHAYIQDFYPESRLKKINADAVCPHYHLLRLGFIKRMQRLNLPVYVWTVNDKRRMEKVLAKGANGLITDDIVEAMEVIKGRDRLSL